MRFENERGVRGKSGGRSEQSGVEIMAGLLLEAGENRDQGSKLLLLHYYAGEHLAKSCTLHTQSD